MASALLSFLVASAVWVALSVPHMLAVAADGHGGEHCAPVLCGNVSVGFPFGVVPEDAAVQTDCGRIEFQVRCRNSIPYLGFYQTEYNLQILSIFYDNASLLIADASKGSGGCHIPATNTTSGLGRPFSVSPVNQNLIFYNCTEPVVSPREGLVETICSGELRLSSYSYARVAAGSSDELRLSSYFLDGCVAAVVPVLGWSANKTNASNYQELIRDGFLVTWTQSVRDLQESLWETDDDDGPIVKSNISATTYIGSNSLVPLLTQPQPSIPFFFFVFFFTETPEAPIPCSSLLSWKPCYVFRILMAPSFISPALFSSSLILILVAAAAPATVQGEGDCSTNNRCGNLTIQEPFGIVPEDATEANCGQIGFQINCQNNIPYLGYYHRSYQSRAHPLQILNIFYDNSSLLVGDTGKLADLTNLSHKDCQHYKFPSTNTSSKIGLPFSISPVNKNLILYSCGKPPAPAEEIVERTCGNSTFVARVGGSYGDQDSSGSRYFLEGCDHSIVMPMFVKSGEANASNFVELISNGFLLTWQLSASAPSLQPGAGEFVRSWS